MHTPGLLVTRLNPSAMWTAFCSCCTEMNLIPAAGKMSRASIKAEPTMPNTLVVPLATRVSVNASLEVILVGFVLHAGSSEVRDREVENSNRLVSNFLREKSGLICLSAIQLLMVNTFWFWVCGIYKLSALAPTLPSLTTDFFHFFVILNPTVRLGKNKLVSGVMPDRHNLAFCKARRNHPTSQVMKF